MSNKKLNEKKSQQLGMPIGTATSKLRLKVIFDLLKHFNYNFCHKCEKEIISSEDLSLTHLKHWLDVDPSLFWRQDNITFTHRDCRAAQLIEDKMIEIQLVDENNKPFKTYTHEGKVYFEGIRGKKYGIKVKNTSSTRLEVVLTVDGRDIISGEKGNYVSQRGYIFNPYQEWTITGFRQTDNSVAAFNFSNKESSYSNLMGSPENIGVIGVAIFKEKEKPLPLIRNYPVVDPFSNPWKPAPWVPWQPTWISQWNDPPFFGQNLGDFSYQDNVKITCDSLNVSHGGGGKFTSSGGSTSKGILRSVKQNIGTEYGETIKSSISHTSFSRINDEPIHVMVFYYDDYKGLRARGVISEKPKDPNPFPDVPQVSPGYAAKPPISKYGNNPKIYNPKREPFMTDKDVKQIVNKLEDLHQKKYKK